MSQPVFFCNDIVILPPIKKIYGLIPGKNSITDKTIGFVREKNESISYMLCVIIIVLCCFLIYQAVIISTNIGKTTGENYIKRNANLIELNSLSPIAMNGIQASLKYSNDIQYYVYSDFHLITKNNGKYYLFKELDPQTCKPTQVYIIDESSIDQVILSPAEDISDQCSD